MSVPVTLPFNLQNNTVADANEVMANFDAIDTALGNAAAAGVNADITSLTALSTPISPAQGGTPVYIGNVSTGATNVYAVASLSPSGFALALGVRATFTAGSTNDDEATLELQGTGPVAVLRMTPTGLQVLIGGEIVAGNVIEVIYNGTDYVLLQDAAIKTTGPLVDLASGTTTSLFSVPSRNINITGTADIDSFGVVPDLNYPVFFVTFNDAGGALINGANLVLPGGADIDIGEGDFALVQGFAGDVWQVMFYQRAASQPYRRLTPTTQVFTTGATDYVTPAFVTYIKVRLIGGGGGGGGSSTNNGGAGGTTSFAGVDCNGGAGGLGVSGQTGGAGGSGGGGTADLRFPGGDGSSAPITAGGTGGCGPFGGGGRGGAPISAANGVAGATNSGAGGGGFGGAGGAAVGAAGGGAGEYAEVIIGSPDATYAYSVGGGGTAGTGGGGAGAAGIIIVEEFYN